jgi:hypothetical protein
MERTTAAYRKARREFSVAASDANREAARLYNEDLDRRIAEAIARRHDEQAMEARWEDGAADDEQD